MEHSEGKVPEPDGWSWCACVAGTLTGDEQADGRSKATSGSAALSESLPPINPDRTALVVLHYQTDILSVVSQAAPTLLARTRRLCDMARARGVQIYFKKIQFSAGYPEVGMLNRSGQALKASGLFLSDTIAPELEQRDDEPLIIGRRVSAFSGTGLQEHLLAAGIDTLILAGIESTGVVLSTVSHASDADYRIYTVKDCCYDRDQVVHEHLFSTAFHTRTYVISLEEAATLLA